MGIPGLKTAIKTVTWLHNRVNPGAIILGYHRIARVGHDSFYNCVSPENFDQQMEVLRKHTNPVHLIDLVERLIKGDPLPKTVCVTVDDGYSDTLYNAKPILEKHNIPATVFVTTGNFGREFWWDEIDRYILGLSERAGVYRLKVGNRVSEWDFSNTDREERGKQVVAIANLLRPLDDKHRRQLVDELKGWGENSLPEEELQARSMTIEELVALVDSDLVNIGSHSVTHPLMASLSLRERRYELIESKRTLEQIISRPVIGFSYPNGNFMASDPELVHQSGYQYACASMIGTVQQATSPFALPRFWVKDVSGDSFHRWLKLWL